jgi:hypothetical protein
MKKVTPRDFRHLKVGDEVTRMLAGVVEMKLQVTEVDENFIYCGPWTFERVTGFEYDPEIGSGSEFGIIASFLV